MGMAIDSPKGTKVYYVGASDDQVRWGIGDDPRGKLVRGGEYTVDHTDIHGSYTTVYLEGIDGRFNSVCFASELPLGLETENPIIPQEMWWGKISQLEKRIERIENALKINRTTPYARTTILEEDFDKFIGRIKDIMFFKSDVARK